jgi:hypothetical protein
MGRAFQHAALTASLTAGDRGLPCDSEAYLSNHGTPKRLIMPGVQRRRPKPLSQENHRGLQTDRAIAEDIHPGVSNR